MAHLRPPGNLTDLFGERIIYRPQPLEADATGFLNACGVLASSAGFGHTHRAVCEAMRGNAEAARRLQPWGLADPALDPWRSTAGYAAEVARVLRARRSRLLGGIATQSRRPRETHTQKTCE